MVNTSMGLSNVDAGALQSARPQLRPEAGEGRPQGNEAPRQDIQVSISAEARAAEQAARLAAPDQASAAQAVAGTQSAAPVQAPTAGDTASAAASASAVPAAQAETARAERTTGNAVPPQPPANPQRPREPDASSVEGNQAVQLYLDNATRPDNQPAPSVIRETA